MAIDFTTATSEEILAELANYTIERRLLAYRTAEEKIISIGQENWNGDKKHYEARLAEVQEGIKMCEAQLANKKLASKCPFKGCDVRFY